MSDEMVSVEVVLAAVVDSQGGSVTVPAETFDKDLSGYVLALDYHQQKNELTITLVDKDTAVYEDE